MLSSYMQRERFKVFYVYVQNKLVITTDTKDIAKKIAIQHGFKNFEITETKKADDKANENGYFLEPVKNGFKICEPKPKEKSLSELKAEKLEALTAYAGQFDQYKCDGMYVTSAIGGYKFNADIRSQTNMQGLIDVLDEGTTTLYKDYDNEFRTMTKADLAVLKSECLQNGQYLYQHKWTLQTKINACTC